MTVSWLELKSCVPMTSAGSHCPDYLSAHLLTCLLSPTLLCSHLLSLLWSFTWFCFSSQFSSCYYRIRRKNLRGNEPQTQSEEFKMVHLQAWAWCQRVQLSSEVETMRHANDSFSGQSRRVIYDVSLDPILWLTLLHVTGSGLEY